MMVVGASPRARIFTATWPALAPAQEIIADSRDGGKEPSGPFCQVQVRAVLLRTSNGALSSGETAGTQVVDGHGGEDNLVFVERSLLLRSYNSVSLAEDGTYSLALSDCHGFISTSAYSSVGPHPRAPIPQGVGHGGDGSPMEMVRLLFLSLPASIEFDVEGGQLANLGTAVGNFHLLPVAHVPPAMSGRRSESNVIREANRDHESAPPAGDLLQAAGDCDPWPSQSPSSRDLFLSGAVVGAALCVLSAWLVVARGWGTHSWSRFCGLFDGEGGSGAGWREAVADVRAARKEGCAQAIGDGDRSDDGSVDSDMILNGNVPEPVGLPRSDEDWRTLFDTLYEDRAATEASQAKAAAPTPTNASAAVGACRDYPP